MKLSRNWLSDFVDLSGFSNKELSEIVTTRIAEVDSILEIGPGFEHESVKLTEEDLIIEIDNKSLTHRPDLWSHFGFARELSAVLDRPLKLDLDRFSDDTAEGIAEFSKLLQGQEAVKITIEPGTKMRRMMACIFENVEAVESPLWMKQRLASIGAGVRNFLVDLSNYVMHDSGQPNHFFDADKIDSSAIWIRFAKANEPLKTLDLKDRQLSSEDLVIADKNKALDIGGVMGGADTSIHEGTKRILFTAGCWDPILVRKSAQRNQARTDAAQRFEKNLSPYLPLVSLQRIRMLLSEGCPSAKLAGKVSDVFPEKHGPVKIALTAKLVKERLGDGAPDFSKSCKILEQLRMKFIEKTSDSCLIEVPHYRATRDLSIPEDLIEEIGRCHGYENIHEKAPLIASTPSEMPALKALEYEICDLLRGAGFSEVSNYSFVEPVYSEQVGYPTKDAVELANPIDETQGALRTSLVPGMLRTIELNAKYSLNFRVFELGRRYIKSSGSDSKTPALERRFLALGILVSPEAQGNSIPSVKNGSEFYSVVSTIQKIISLRTGLKGVIKPITSTEALQWMHPHRAGSIELDGERLGVIAEIRPKFLPDVKGRAVLAELDCETLLECSKARVYTPVNRFPVSLFELSIVAPRKTAYSLLEKDVRNGVPKELLREIEVLDVYEGAPIPEGMKSVSIRVSFGADDRTISSEELTALQERLMAHVEQSSYSIRR